MELASDSEYTVACNNCHASFDAMASAWCVCLTHDPTLVCPKCRGCLCAAPPEAKREFWAAAPAELWSRRAAEREIRRASPPEPRLESLARPLVLVVDDEPEMRSVAIHLLNRMGYGTLSASDGDAAFSLVQRHRPELVLSDALMPKTDGRELCRRIKQNPETRGVKFVLMTSVYKRRRYEGEAYAQFGVDGFLPKPVGLAELKTELQRQLAGAAFPIPESRSESGTARPDAGEVS